MTIKYLLVFNSNAHFDRSPWVIPSQKYRQFPWPPSQHFSWWIDCGGLLRLPMDLRKYTIWNLVLVLSLKTQAMLPILYLHSNCEIVPPVPIFPKQLLVGCRPSPEKRRPNSFKIWIWAHHTWSRFRFLYQRLTAMRENAYSQLADKYRNTDKHNYPPLHVSNIG